MRSENAMPSLPVTVLKEPTGFEGISIPVPCSAQGIGSLYRLGSEPGSVQSPNGEVSEGIWHWWTSDACPDRQAGIAREQMQAGRVAQGLDPAPDCPMPDVPGKTCRKKFYPERTLYPDGSYREQSWAWVPSAPNRDEYNLIENWNVYFTPEEAKIYAALRSDDYLRALDYRAVLAIYYSLLNYRCVGRVDPVLEPSPVSPQSLSRRYDLGSQSWLEFWENSLRDRIWIVRTDLRQVRLPSGELVAGLQPPENIRSRPSCTTTTGQIVGYVAAALSLYAGVPSWIDVVMKLPDTVVGFRNMLSTLGRASQIQQALLGAPSPVEQKLIEQANGKTPTGVAGEGSVISGSGSIPLWLLAAGAYALLG